MLGSAESQVPKLINREVIFAEFQRVWSQSTNVTDGRTDGQTTYHGNTALRYASRGKNVIRWAQMSSTKILHNIQKYEQHSDTSLSWRKHFVRRKCQATQDHEILIHPEECPQQLLISTQLLNTNATVHHKIHQALEEPTETAEHQWNWNFQAGYCT